MRFWKQNPDRQLERRLRAERPQPRDEFVRLLAGEAPARVTAKSAPRRAQRAILVAALTATLVVALAAAGGIAYASHSASTFGQNVHHVFSTDHQSVDPQDPGDPFALFSVPFRSQYGFVLPICDSTNTLQYVPLVTYFFDLLHGYHPASFNGTNFFCRSIVT